MSRMIPLRIERKRPVRCEKVQVSSGGVVRLPHENIRKIWAEYARQIRAGLEFILVLVMGLMLPLDEGIAGEYPAGLQAMAYRTQDLSHLRFVEMLDRRVPDDVVESTARHADLIQAYGLQKAVREK